MELTPNLSKKTTRKIDKIIIHCSATKEGQNMTVEQIDKAHSKRGFAGIGYHFVIYLDGSIHDGRDICKIGAHCTGYNTGSIGICYVGGLDKRDKNGKMIKDTRTAAQKNALYQLVKILMYRYPIKEVKGHRDYSPDTNGDGVISKYEWIKGCPCFEVSQFMEEYDLNKLLKS